VHAHATQARTQAHMVEDCQSTPQEEEEETKKEKQDIGFETIL
jgi:hypothetical protein